MRNPRCRWTALVTWSALAAVACVSRVEREAVTPRGADPTDPTLGGALVVEQFLRAVNTRDFETMSRLFGTKQGPIVALYDRRQVERRMLALAGLLEHEDYSIQGAAPVSGRSDGARQMIVRMSVRGRETDVPYTLVWSDTGSWLVEQIDLERVTGR